MTALILGSIVFGLAQGGAIALLGAGVVAINRGSRVINLAHGAMGMMATYAYAAVVGQSLSPTLSQRIAGALAGLACGVLLGLAVHVVTMRPLAGRPPWVRMTATLGVLYILISFAQLVFGASTRSVASLFGPGGHHAGQVTLTNAVIGTGVVAAIASVALALFYQRTRAGTVIRAVADSPEAAQLGGIRIGAVSAASWALGGGLAAVAGILLAPSVGLNSFILTLLVIQALAAALTGRLERLLPTLLGGLAIGVLTALARSLLDSATASHPPAWINLTDIQDGIAVVWALGAMLVWRRRSIRFGTSALAGRDLPRIIVDHRVRTPLIVLALLAALLVPPLLSSSNLYLTSLGAADAVAVLSLVVVTGMGGQLSLAQAAFMGVGAFAAAHLVDDAHLSFWLALPAGGLLAVPVGLLTAWLTLPLRGVLVAVVTLAIGEAVTGLFLTAPVNGGGFGSMPLPRPAVLANPVHYCWLELGVLAVLIAFVCAIRTRRTGRVLIAAGESESAARSVGISIATSRLTAFGLSAFIAGVAGVLYAGISGVASAGRFTALESISLVAAGVVGGLGSTAGAVIGGLLTALGPGLVSGLPVLSALADPGDAAGALLGALLIIQVTAAPAGLSRSLLRVESRLAGWMRAHVLRPSTPPAEVLP